MQKAAKQEAEQPKPGENSQAVASSVSENMAQRPPMKIVSNFGSARPTPAAAYKFNGA
ncbi:MAG: hypothetical protein FWC26_14525 [Fibromonadales bacterium]|nr:hypothetical protein [Fibromonadales bacterium]